MRYREEVTEALATQSIEPRPATQAPTPARTPSVLTSGELVTMIEDLRDQMNAAQERFDNKDAIDAETNKRKGELASLIADLSAKLDEARTEMRELEEDGSVRDGFIKSASKFEQEVNAIATGVWGHLSERISREKYDGSSYRELPSSLKDVVLFKLGKLGIKAFTLPSFQRLHSRPKEAISNALLEQSMERVHNAMVKLEEVLES
jgi:hypothetical protein